MHTQYLVILLGAVARWYQALPLLRIRRKKCPSLSKERRADPAVVADAEQRMAGTSPEAAYAILMGLGGSDSSVSVRRLEVPLRAINGDLYPTDLVGVRKIKPDFEAIIMKHMGHYPMLERPEEFNCHVATIVKEFNR